MNTWPPEVEMTRTKDDQMKTKMPSFCCSLSHHRLQLWPIHPTDLLSCKQAAFWEGQPQLAKFENLKNLVAVTLKGLN